MMYAGGKQTRILQIHRIDLKCAQCSQAAAVAEEMQFSLDIFDYTRHIRADIQGSVKSLVVLFSSSFLAAARSCKSFGIDYMRSECSHGKNKHCGNSGGNSTSSRRGNMIA